MTPAERTTRVRREAARLCLALGWSPLHEVGLPDGRRADILALRPDGGFVCIEVKSSAEDFRADRKWQEYRAYSDALYFAVDLAFPQALLPDDVGLIVVAEMADMVREAPSHPLSAPRRRALLFRFAQLAAIRLAAREDPAGYSALLAAGLSE